MLALSVAALVGCVVTVARYAYNYRLDRLSARHATRLF